MPANTTAMSAETYHDDPGSPVYGDYPARQQETKAASSKSKHHRTRDCIDQLCTHVNHDLLVAKTFYFFFFSAFGSLFPLLAVYFKQLGLNATQCGVLIGFRPFVEFCSAPLWGGVADKWKKGKQILLFALFCWVAFTLAMAFIQPPAHSCIRKNRTHVILAKPVNRERRSLMYDPFSPYFTNNHMSDGINDIVSEYWDDHEADDSSSEIRYPEDYFIDSNIVDTDPPNDPWYNDFIYRHPWSQNKDAGKRYGNPYKADVYRWKRDLSKKDDVDVELERYLQRIKRDNSNYNNDYNSESEEGDYASPDYVMPHPVNPDKIGKSPLPLDHSQIANADEGDTKGLVKPPFTSIVYREDQVQEAFLLLLLVIIIGEFFSAPAITLADTVTLTYLGEDSENYGRQRMFGSLGWGLAMFFVGIALDHSTTFPEHPCGKQVKGEKNYVICFAVFSVLMSCAFIAATQMKFHYDDGKEEVPLRKIAGKVKDHVQHVVDGTKPVKRKRLVEEYDDDDQAREEGRRKFDPDSESPTPEDEEPALKIDLEKGSSDMVSDATNTQDHGPFPDMPKYFTVLKLFGNLRYGSFMFVTWFMGFGTGLIFTFLFWHLQDLGGSPTLFGIASIINHISEILAYFFCNKLLQAVGHVKVLYIGLAGNVARFLYISWLRNPWWVLPFEFIQGLTHAAVWGACCSYITQITPLNLRCSAQGILQGIHHGLGRGCGAVFGGILAFYFGTEYTFRGYGFACLVLGILFFALNFFIKDPSELSDGPGPDEPPDILEESAHLAPCGVPMNPLARNLSSSKLSDMDQQQDPSYGSTNANGMLHPQQQYQPQRSESQEDGDIGNWPSMMDSYSQIKSKLGHKDARTYQQMSNGIRNGDLSPEELSTPALVMHHPPPIKTDMQVLQPEPRLNETQYQFTDDW